MNVMTADGNQTFFVSSGSYTINADATVSVIAEEACRVADLDKDAAAKALAAAQVRTMSVFNVGISHLYSFTAILTPSHKPLG